MIKKALKGIRIEVTHRGVNCMKYNISGLTSQATQDLKFPLGDTDDMVYLVDYFRDTYKFSIQHMQWPCLEVGYSKKVKGQRCSKRLNDRHITALLKVTCQRPQDREQGIPAHLVCT